MSGDPEQDYFADGITEDIITELSKVSGLFVIARNSSFAYKGKAPDVRQVGRELGVRYVLEGSVRKAGEPHPHHRAADRRRRPAATSGPSATTASSTDIFAVQDEITRTIVDALKVQLTPDEEARREQSRQDRPGGLRPARPRATDVAAAPARGRDPGARDARAGDRDRTAACRRLCPARGHHLRRIYQPVERGDDRQLRTAPSKSRKRALEIDETEQQAHIAMAIMLTWQRRLDEAERHAERAIALDPNASDSYTGLGNVREYQGRPADAVALYTRAYRLDPQWDMALHFMGRALLALGRLDEAENAFKKRLLLSPRSDMTRFYLACVHARRGRYEEARRLWDELIAINPAFSIDHYPTHAALRRSDDVRPGDRTSEGRRHRCLSFGP